MRVATFFSDSMWASWTLSRGFPEAVQRCGHEVVPVPVPATKQITKSLDAKIRATWPTIEELNGCDAIILNGVEHLADWLFHVYGEAWFKEVKAKRIGWFHESLIRPDYNVNYGAIARFCDEVFLPNPDDADDKSVAWLPVGVDTEMFQKLETPALKPIEVGFIGLLYEKRKKFMDKLVPHLGDIKVAAGNVQVCDLSGVRFREQTELLAENYRNMEILLNLPSLSNVLVMKVLEAMSCGTCVFTPHMAEHFEEKLGFESGVHLVYYDQRDPGGLAKALRLYLDSDDLREQVARQGMELVRGRYRIEDRIHVMLGEDNGTTRHLQGDLAEQPA